MIRTDFIKRMILFCLGFFFIAVGVTLSMKSDLGLSPVSSVPYVLSQITGIEQGKLTTAVFICYIFIQYLLLGKQFHKVRLLQLIPSVLFGYFVTVSNKLFAAVPIQTCYPLQLLCLALSMVVMAFGLFLYISTDLTLQPPDGMTDALSQKVKIPFHKMKSIFDCSLVVISASLSVVFLHRLVSVREGTLISAIGVGMILGVYMRQFGKPLRSFLNVPVTLQDAGEGKRVLEG